MSFEIYIGIVLVLILVMKYFTRGKPPYWIQLREKRTGKKVSINVVDEDEDDCPHKPKNTYASYDYNDRWKGPNINRD